MSDKDFLTKLLTCAKFKDRSHQKYHNIHLPELNARLNLDLNLPSPPEGSLDDDPFAAQPDLSNTTKIRIVYLGNSMLERLKTTGKDTRLAQLQGSWNAGCGGDKNENIVWRLGEGMYEVLKKAQEQGGRCDIKLWIVASGTNNLNPKRGFRLADLESYRALLEACLRIAPESRVVVCDMFYRNDMRDDIVERCNEMLKGVVDDVNRGLVGIGEKKIVWVEGRKPIGHESLVDHVHLNKDGYQVWDGILWPYVEVALGLKEVHEERLVDEQAYT